MANPLPPLEGLDVEGDYASVGHRWEKWKIVLLIYLVASNINTVKRKRKNSIAFWREWD